MRLRAWRGELHDLRVRQGELYGLCTWQIEPDGSGFRAQTLCVDEDACWRLRWRRVCCHGLAVQLLDSHKPTQTVGPCIVAACGCRCATASQRGTPGADTPLCMNCRDAQVCVPSACSVPRGLPRGRRDGTAGRKAPGLLPFAGLRLQRGALWQPADAASAPSSVEAALNASAPQRDEHACLLQGWFASGSPFYMLFYVHINPFCRGAHADRVTFAFLTMCFFVGGTADGTARGL
mmetsp:Transcript_42620/g.127914  ORF Transcript_42620/g.127914 Transcript_42620/m.127914 type:complete len:235 (-) Transcript_42620:251-955(-)